MVHSFKVWSPRKQNGKTHYRGFASASTVYRASCKTSSCFRYWEAMSLGDLEKTSKNLRNSKTPFLPAAKANTDRMEPRGFASASINCGHRFLIHTQVHNNTTADIPRASDGHHTDRLLSCHKQFYKLHKDGHGLDTDLPRPWNGLATDFPRTSYGLVTGLVLSRDACRAGACVFVGCSCPSPTNTHTSFSTSPGTMGEDAPFFYSS